METSRDEAVRKQRPFADSCSIPIAPLQTETLSQRVV